MPDYSSSYPPLLPQCNANPDKSKNQSDLPPPPKQLTEEDSPKQDPEPPESDKTPASETQSKVAPVTKNAAPPSAQKSSPSPAPGQKRMLPMNPKAVPGVKQNVLIQKKTIPPPGQKRMLPVNQKAVSTGIDINERGQIVLKKTIPPPGQKRLPLPMNPKARPGNTSFPPPQPVPSTN